MEQSPDWEVGGIQPAPSKCLGVKDPTGLCLEEIGSKVNTNQDYPTDNLGPPLTTSWFQGQLTNDQTYCFYISECNLPILRKPLTKKQGGELRTQVNCSGMET